MDVRLLEQEQPLADVEDAEDLAPGDAGRVVLGAIAAAGLAMIALSFQVWVDFGVTETKGPDADALTGVSDGYLVAAAGALISMSALGVVARPAWAAGLLPAIGAFAVVVLAVAGYTVATSWRAAGIDSDGVFLVDGDPTAVPYAIAGIAVGVAFLAAILAAMRASRLRTETGP